MLQLKQHFFDSLNGFDVRLNCIKMVFRLRFLFALPLNACFCVWMSVIFLLFSFSFISCRYCDAIVCNISFRHFFRFFKFYVHLRRTGNFSLSLLFRLYFFNLSVIRIHLAIIQYICLISLPNATKRST